MPLSRILLFNSLAVSEMQFLARNVAGKIRPGDVITFSGEIGSGKTTFAREVIKTVAVGDIREITSPTFTLMQSYDVGLAGGVQEVLWHIDLYRLEHEEEAEELGLRELWPHVTLIEWPRIIEKQIPKQRLDISFDFGKNGDTRTLVFSGDDIWKERLSDLK